MGQALFVFAQAFALYRLIRSGLYRTFPDLSLYLSISAVVAILPRHPESSAWWHSWFIVQQIILFAALIPVILEAFEVATLEFLAPEIRGFRAALWGALLLAVGSAWRLDPCWSWFHDFTAVRQYLQFGLFLAVAAGGGYIWQREIPLTRHTRAHVWILLWFLAGTTASRMLDPHVGMLAGTGSRIGWQAVNIAAYLNASACSIAWAIAFKRPSVAPVDRKFVRAFCS